MVCGPVLTVHLAGPTILKPKMKTINRRTFIKTTALATTLAAPCIGRSGAGPASERARLAFIGCGGRTRQMIPMFQSFSDVDVVAVSDVIESRMDQACEILAKGERPQEAGRFLEYERILERNDVDAVVISTTQHWHGLPHILAAQAGKHIFVEKPLSHTVVEGRRMVQASDKHGVVSIMGTQQRAGPHYQKAVELIQAGRLGKIALVECWNYHNTGARTGRSKDADPPAGLHWDRWLGPAPLVNYNPSRLNNSWWFDYAGGMMTNWGIHHIDIILWAMNDYSPQSAVCSGGKFVVDDLADTPDTIEASWQFPGWVMHYRYRGFNNFHSVQDRPHHHGIAFYGNQATMVLDRHGFQIWDDGHPKEVAQKMDAVPYFNPRNPGRSEQDGPWQRLFIDCVKGLKQPPLSLEQSHQGTVCCHLANISYLCGGRRIVWDAQKENVVGDAEASQLLDRPRRKGYELPKV
jgi:predicted dehydrogenase